MTPRDVDPELVEQLRRERLRYYGRGGASLVVPDPRRPLPTGPEPTNVGLHDDRRPVCAFLAALLLVIWVGNLIDVALVEQPDLVVWLRLFFVSSLVGVVGAVVWGVRASRGKRVLPQEVAMPWLDVLEGLRLGSVQPANPAWPVALSHAADVQAAMVAMRSASRSGRHAPDPGLVDRVQRAGVEVHALAEAWRAAATETGQGAHSPLDRLPDVVGPTARRASVESDAASDAATEALGLGDHDIDFDGYARRRASMYARADGPARECADPRHPLPDTTAGHGSVRRRVRAAWWTVAGSVVLVVVLWNLGLEWESVGGVLVALSALGFIAGAAPRDHFFLTTALPAGQAMAWTDYLDQVHEADSGWLPVTTVEAIRGCEPRVRACLVELTSSSASDAERPLLEAELFRLCSEVWTLVGQARVERGLAHGADPSRESPTA